MAARLLGTYVTPIGVNATTPVVVTLDQQATPGRTVFALAVSSVALTIASPWTSVATGSGGTVYGSWKLAPADNVSGITTVTVTQGATRYPFALLVFEDDVNALQSSAGASSVAPSAGSWNGRSGLSFTSTWRSIWIWAGVRFQTVLAGDITAYSNGLAELGDTGPSGIDNSTGADWYSCEIWAAQVDGLSGSVTPVATTSSTATGGWVACIAYTVAVVGSSQVTFGEPIR